MGATERLPVEAIGEADLADLLALSHEARWNQTDADWRVFLTRGTVFGCRAPSGGVIASAALLPYDGGFGWISMVLVTEAWRRRGLATALVRQCIDLAGRSSIVPILDATPDGAQVYGALGFRPVFPLTRWRRGGIGGDPSDDVGRDEAGIAKLTEMDARAFGADRAFLLSDFAHRPGSRVIRHDGPGGAAAAIVRGGDRAYHIGPVVGENEAGAVTVLKAAAAGISGAIVVDVPDQWARLGAALQQLGFERQRPFLRMAMEREEAFGNPDRMFCAAGPEFG